MNPDSTFELAHMSDRYSLLGMDTAWRRFESARGGSKSIVDAPHALARGLRRQPQSRPETVHLAAELAALEPALEGRRANGADRPHPRLYGRATGGKHPLSRHRPTIRRSDASRPS